MEGKGDLSKLDPGKEGFLGLVVICGGVLIGTQLPLYQMLQQEHPVWAGALLGATAGAAYLITSIALRLLVRTKRGRWFTIPNDERISLTTRIHVIFDTAVRVVFIGLSLGVSVKVLLDEKYPIWVFLLVLLPAVGLTCGWILDRRQRAKDVRSDEGTM